MSVKDDKPALPPKKWNPFAAKDSRAIEAAFQKLGQEEDGQHRGRTIGKDSTGIVGKDTEPKSGQQPNRSLGAGDKESAASKVPVNEDYLFDVDIPNRELGPTFWLGNVYDVRRGTWFFVEGVNLRPCDENLAVQLEEGYLKTKPWRTSSRQSRSLSRPRTDSISSETHDGSKDHTSDTENKNMFDEPADMVDARGSSSTAPIQTPALTHRLFGAYMNSLVTYQDSSTAWLLSDDFLSKVSSTVYQRFAGGAHLSGTKLVRGYTDPAKRKAKDTKRAQTPPPSSERSESKARSDDAIKEKATKRLSMPPAPDVGQEVNELDNSQDVQEKQQPEPRLRTLERQMSSLLSNALPEDPEKQDEEARKREEEEIRDDYKDTPGDAQDREIEHLILVTHGIGQRLGARFESFNFIHDVNELRKTLKSVYGMSTDLQALNAELDEPFKNCRIQVLPICWRHLLDFPRHSLKRNKKEFDLTENDMDEDEDQYPSLQDITVEGVPALRNIVADLALDILLYQNQAYKDHISRIVAGEANRIYGLFKERNPTFHGKVSLIGHSLGSAVFFDVLSDQAKANSTSTKLPPGGADIALDFEVENMFCLGSPIGLFQMLKGKTIAARASTDKQRSERSTDGIKDLLTTASHALTTISPVTSGTTSDPIYSSPKCHELFNIFHPSDPIAYRLEPLITPAMSTLKPQPLPYTKKGIFGAPIGQGFTGIPARVGQSFSGLWSNFSSGLASSFINRSLGISAADAAKLNAPAASSSQQSRIAQSLGGGTNIVGGGVITSVSPQAMAVLKGEDEKKRKLSLDAQTMVQLDEHPPTLIDSEMETLYSGFQKRRKSAQENDANLRDLGESPAWQELEEQGRKLRREEAKVRALNSNGRVDYSIQE